jgi:TonB-dependent receptor
LFGNVKLSGNIGIRYVDTRAESSGSIGVPSRQAVGVTDTFAVRCPTPQPPPGSPPGTPAPPVTGVCLLGQAGYDQLRTFASGLTVADTAQHNYHRWLPALNLKLDLSRNLLARFAASIAMTRPLLSDIRNYVTIGTDTSNGFHLAATAGNPFLKPATSKQFDFTLEWYFARVGSLTFDAFYKSIHNFFYQSVTQRNITSNGVTQTVDVRGPANFEGHGKVKGFEVAYQQTFDFLPWIFNGLGLSANYTYIDSKGLPNSRLNGGAPVNNSPIGTDFNIPLEQLSKHNVNVAAFYEKGPVSLRVAYNWRSRFLLTSADVIFPYYPIFNEKTGNLDASVFVNISKQVKLGLQAVNLTNEVTKTSQMFTTSGLLGPRSYFMNDRRYSVILRGNF